MVEEQGMRVSEALRRLNACVAEFSAVPGPKAAAIARKCEAVFSKNKGLATQTAISASLSARSNRIWLAVIRQQSWSCTGTRQ